MSDKIFVIKRGRRPSQEFDPSKLHKSIIATCRSVKTPEGQSEDLAKKTTLEVMRWCETRPEITSDDIRRQASKILKKYHEDASYLYENYKSII